MHAKLRQNKRKIGENTIPLIKQGCHVMATTLFYVFFEIVYPEF